MILTILVAKNYKVFTEVLLEDFVGDKRKRFNSFGTVLEYL